MIVETERLLIRRFVLADSELIYKYSQEDITKAELPDEVFASPTEAEQAITYFIANYDSKYPLVYAIVQKAEPLLIGHISLSSIDKGVEIGFAIGTDYQNRGYMSECLIPFIQWAKITLGLSNIYGIVKTHNKSSWRVLEKCGFNLISEGVFTQYFKGQEVVKVYAWSEELYYFAILKHIISISQNIIAIPLGINCD